MNPSLELLCLAPVNVDLTSPLKEMFWFVSSYLVSIDGIKEVDVLTVCAVPI